MKVTQIEFTRLHNLGNYEHEKLVVTAIVEDGEDPAAAAADLRGFVEHQIEKAQMQREEQWALAEERYDEGEDEPEKPKTDGDPFAEE